MRVIILNQFFYPDISATSQLMTELGESLVERGLEVTALAGRGLYNGGDRLPSRGEYRGVRIERAWSTSFGKGSGAARLSDYLSFYTGAAWKLLTLPRHDVVLALTTPPLISLPALLICRLRGMKLLALVQDVYPDVAVALGTLKAHSPGTRLLSRLNRLVIKGADRIIVLGECMRERIIAGVGAGAQERIDVIHNWADGDVIRPLGDERNPFVEEHKLGDRFIVLFSGNFGRVNDFKTVLEAASLLRDHKEIQFLFIGEGAKRSEIEAYVSSQQLSNITLLPYQPRHLLPYSLAAGHLHLVTLADGLAGLSVPSKTYGILAAGRPVIFVGDARSDIARIIDEHQCGQVFRTGEKERLARFITELACDRERLERWGREARALFENHFERRRAASAYVESLRRCAADETSNRPEQSEPSASKCIEDSEPSTAAPINNRNWIL